jgi:DNA polymerase III subunit epsilon
MRRADTPAARAYRKAPLPDPRAPWREVTFSVIDFETTGLDPAIDEIISFATVTVAEGRVRVDDARYELVRPSRMPDADTIRIHGLRETELSEASPLSEVLDDLLAAITGRPLVAHVAAVERGFLGAALSAHGLELGNPVVDTAAMDRELRRLRRRPPVSREPIGLSDLARSLGLPVHRPHHADGDALTTAQAFVALATHLEAFGLLTLGSLEHLSPPVRRKPLLRSILGRFGLGSNRR